MITIKNVKTLDGQTTDVRIPSSREYTLEAKGQLLMIPGVIDSHISFGSPIGEEWPLAIESAIGGGITTVLDIPTKDSPSGSQQELLEKKRLVDKGLSDLNVPLQYFMYRKSNSKYVEEMGLEKSLIKGSLIHLTSEDRLNEEEWIRIFQMSAWHDLPVVINSQNENTIEEAGVKQPNATLLDKAIHYAEKQNARLYVLNVATRDELDLIQQARFRSLLIYAETTPQHLFPRHASQADFLWDSLNSGAIETVGSGYHVEVPHQEKLSLEEGNFDFLNPIFLLPLLLSAYHEGKITLENIVRLTRANLYDIFRLENDKDVVLIDLEKEHTAQRVMKQNSIEIKLKGWPVYTIVKGQIFTSSKLGCHLTHVE